MKMINQIEEKKYTIYCHTNKINGKKYVGQTCKINPSYRWVGGKGYKCNEHFTRAIEKYGWDNFEHEILFTNLTLNEANELEKKIISSLDLTNPNKGYNNKDGGKNGSHTEETKEKISKASLLLWQKEGHRKLMSEKIKNAKKGYTVTEETRQKLINSHKGQVPWNKGKKASKETVEKQKLAWVKKKERGFVPWNKGRKCSEETREKLRQYNIGKKLSEETKMKISESLKGKKKKPFTEEHRKNLGASSKGRKWTEEQRKKIHNSLSNRKWINKDGERKWVKQDKLKLFLSNGWSFGMEVA